MLLARKYVVHMMSVICIMVINVVFFKRLYTCRGCITPIDLEIDLAVYSATNWRQIVLCGVDVGS